MNNPLVKYMSDYCECINEMNDYDLTLEKYAENFVEKCNYDNVFNPNTISYNVNKEFTFLHINIQSLPSKLDKFKLFLYKLNQKCGRPDFILLCETFLTDINSKTFNIDGYKMVTNNRQYKKGGGVCILVKNDINFEMCDDLSYNLNDEFESIFIKVNCKL